MDSSSPGSRLGSREVPRVLAAVICVWAAMPSAGAKARDLVVFGEPTLMTALERLGQAWRARSGTRVNVFVAPTDLSLAQIDRGARCDVIFALDGAVLRDAERREIVKADETVPALRNSRVLVARPDAERPSAAATPGQPQSLLAGRRVAIANPDRDVGGAEGLRWLRQAGGGEDDQNVVTAESSAGVLTFLADNVAPLGIVYATDAAARPDLPVLARMGDEDNTSLRYVVRQAKDAQTDTRPFFAFLASAEGRAILKTAGLRVAGE